MSRAAPTATAWIGACLALCAAAFAVPPPEQVEAMRERTVKVRGVQQGFGFVAGAAGDRLYIVTANHVVRDEDGNTAPRTTVEFFDAAERPFDAEPSPSSYDRRHDLAVLVVDRSPAPTFPTVCALTGLEDYRLAVWYIGRGGRFDIPGRPGGIGNSRPDGDQLLWATLDSVAGGTSGAPLVAEEGVVGMMVRDVGDAEAKALSLDFISDRFGEWRLPWSLADCSPAAAVPRVSTRFPLLEDPPEETWVDRRTGQVNERARDLLTEAKTALEYTDLLCAAPPNLGFDWPFPNGLRTSSFDVPLGALRRLDESVALHDNPWSRFYRGLALAQLRAFDPALEDLGSAKEEFRRAGEFAPARTAGQISEIVERWRSQPVPLPSELKRADSCRLDGEAWTACQLRTRVQWSELAIPEQRKLLTRIRQLVAGDDRRPPGSAAPEAGMQIGCAIELARELDEVEIFRELFEYLLEASRRHGIDLLVADSLRPYYRKLIQADQGAAAREILGEHLDYLSKPQRLELLVLDAFEPNVSQAEFDALLADTVPEPDLVTVLSGLKQAATRLRVKTEWFSGRVFAEASALGDDAILRMLTYFDEGSDWSAEGQLELVRAAGLDQGKIETLTWVMSLTAGFREAREQLLARLRQIRNSGAIAEDLGTRLDMALDLEAGAAEAAGGLEPVLKTVLLGSYRQVDGEWVASPPDGDPNGSEAHWQWAPAIALLLALDTTLFEEDPLHLGLLQVSMAPVGERKEVFDYRYAANLWHASLDIAMPEVKELLMTTVLSGGPLAGWRAYAEKLEDCDSLDCLGVIRELLDAAGDSDFAELLRPILRAHEEARRSILTAIAAPGVQLAPDELYALSLVESLKRQVTEGGFSDMTADQQLLLLGSLQGLGWIFKEGFDWDLQVEDVATPDPDLDMQVLELVAAFRSWRAASELEDLSEESIRPLAAQAAGLLATARHPLVRTFMLLNPFSYYEKSPGQIEALVDELGLKDHGASLQALALQTAAYAGSPEFEDGCPKEKGFLSFEQLQAMTTGIDRDFSLAGRWPFTADLAGYAGQMRPLTAWDPVCDEDEWNFGWAWTEWSGLHGSLHCVCCVAPEWLWPELVSAAVAEKQWLKAEELLRSLVEKAESGRPWSESLATAALTALCHPREAPPALVALASSQLLRPEVWESLDEYATIRLPPTLIRLQTSGLAASRKVDRDLILDSLGLTSELVARAARGESELSLSSLLRFSGWLRDAARTTGDALLEWHAQRQTGRIRGLLITRLQLERRYDDIKLLGGESAESVLDGLEEDAAEGDPRALCHLGWLAARSLGAWGREPVATDLLAQEAASGDREAMRELGLAHAHGRSAEVDGELAEQWLERAIELGDEQAMNDLGMLHLEGRGVPRKPKKALGLFLRSAEAGNPEGMNRAALLYLSGDGVRQKRDEALELLERAAALGHPAARSNLNALGTTDPAAATFRLD